MESSKPCATAAELSLAYTPGVAAPVREIHADPENAYRYTNKGNLVAVITDGTAILGLGNLGPLACKPVMEGKAVLFKRFANIDVFDIEVNAPSVEAFIETVVEHRPHLRRHQPGRHRRAALLRNRRGAQETARYPGIPRRPARHRHHHLRRPAQRAGMQGKKLADAKLVCLGAGAAGLAGCAC